MPYSGNRYASYGVPASLTTPEPEDPNSGQEATTKKNKSFQKFKKTKTFRRISEAECGRGVVGVTGHPCGVSTLRECFQSTSENFGNEKH